MNQDVGGKGYSVVEVQEGAVAANGERPFRFLRVLKAGLSRERAGKFASAFNAANPLATRAKIFAPGLLAMFLRLPLMAPPFSRIAAR